MRSAGPSTGYGVRTPTRTLRGWTQSTSPRTSPGVRSRLQLEVRQPGLRDRGVQGGAHARAGRAHVPVATEDRAPEHPRAFDDDDQPERHLARTGRRRSRQGGPIGSPAALRVFVWSARGMSRLCYAPAALRHVAGCVCVDGTQDRSGGRATTIRRGVISLYRKVLREKCVVMRSVREGSHAHGMLAVGHPLVGAPGRAAINMTSAAPSTRRPAAEERNARGASPPPLASPTMCPVLRWGGPGTITPRPLPAGGFLPRPVRERPTGQQPPDVRATQGVPASSMWTSAQPTRASSSSILRLRRSDVRRSTSVGSPR